MFSRNRNFVLFIFSSFITAVLTQYPPQVPGHDIAEVATTDSPSKCIKPLTVNASEGDTYVCQQETAQPQFSVRPGSAGQFCLYYDKPPLSAAQYVLNVSCRGDAGQGNVGELTVYVLPNSPPAVAGGPGLTVDVDVPKSKLGTSVYKIPATDRDGDPLTYTTTTSDPNFTVDSKTGEIYPNSDPRSMTVTSGQVVVDVSDGKNPPTQVTVTLNLKNLNVKPVLTNCGVLSKGVEISEDHPPGDLLPLIISDSLSDPKVSVSGTVSPGSGTALFEFNDVGTQSVRLAAGKSFNAKLQSSYTLTVTLNDGFLNSDVCTIPVKIIDVNDPPVFAQTSYSVEINEGDANSVSVTPPVATDAESDPVTYSMGSGLQSDMFTISGGKLVNTVALDYETLKTIKVNVCASDPQGASSCTTVDITVKDINDNKPVFADGTYLYKISTQTPVNTQFAKLVVTDKDSTTNAEIQFTATCTPDSGQFKIENDYLMLAKPVAVAYGSAVSCEIKAEDKGTNPGPLSSTKTVTFQWNEAPKITNLPATKSLPQGTAVGTVVHTMDVTDPETDPYNCVINTTGVPFKLELSAGKYVVKYDGTEALDSTKKASYTLTVECSDGNGGKDAEDLTLNVEPNQPPVSSTCNPAGTAALDASKPITANAAVFDFGVKDPDNDPVSITIKTSTPTTTLFKVNEASRTLEVTRDLRSETVKDYTLEVEFSDNKNPAVSCNLKITITNMNVAPVIKENGQKVKWSENTAVGTVLFPFTITDTDKTTVTMSTAPFSGSAYFTLDKTTNEIKLKSGLDYETMSDKEFVVTVEATDGFKTTTASVTIEIFDDNDPPKFSSPTYSVSADEGPVGSVTINPSLTVTDTDAGDTHVYTVLPGKDSKYFSVDANTGKLTNLLELDVDNGGKSVFKVDVVATDKKGLQATAEVTVTVNEINDNAPTFDKTNPVTPKNVVVGLTMASTTVVATLSASDIDPGDKGKLKFSLDPTPLGCDYFSVNPDTGAVTLKKKLVESLYGKLIQCKVKVEDQRPPKLSTEITLDIGWNKPPKITNLEGVADIAESQSFAKDIFSLKVADPEDDIYNCERKEPTVPAGIPFEVRKMGDKNFHVFYDNSKPLSLADGGLKKYTLTVICKDVEGGADEKNLIINVKKNQPPTMDCQPEKDTDVVDAGTVGVFATVHTITATEPENENVVFTMKSITPGSALFTVDRGGEIQTTGDLKKDTTGSNLVKMVVVAEDPEKNQATCIVNIRLTNMNKPPAITNLPKTVSLKEDAAAGSEVYKVTLEDDVLCSKNLSVNWQLVNYPQLQNKFDVVVSGKTATVKLALGETIDFEDPIFAGQPPVLRFTLEASDGCLTSLKSELRVELEDINEDPVMRSGLKYSAKFYENDTGVSINLGCDVFDVDKNDILKITLTGKNADKFKISDPKKCILTKIKEYDLDKGGDPKTDLKMTVTDKGGKKVEANVAITILEANEHTPKYDKPAQSFTINEGDPAGKKLGTMTATDKDKPGSLDSTFTHSVKSVSPASGAQFITMDSNGEIKIKQPPDGKVANGQTFKLEVEVCDQGFPKRCSVGYVDVQYIAKPTTTPPPPTVTMDPNANNNNNNNNGGGGSGGSGSGGSDGSGGNLLDNPGIIAMMALLLAAGAGLAALGIFGAYKMWSRGACGNGTAKSPKTYDVSERAASRGSNTASRGSNRVRDSTDIHMTEASGADTKWVYTGTSLEYEPGYVQSVASVESVPVPNQPLASSVRLL